MRTLDSVYSLYVEENNENNIKKLVLKNVESELNGLDVENSDFLNNLTNEVNKYEKISIFKIKLQENLNNFLKSPEAISLQQSVSNNSSVSTASTSSASSEKTNKTKVQNLINLFEKFLNYIQELIVLQIQLILFIYHHIKIVFNFINIQIQNIKQDDITLNNINNATIKETTNELEKKSIFNNLKSLIDKFIALFNRPAQTGQGSINLNTLQDIKNTYERNLTNLISNDGLFVKTFAYLQSLINSFESTIKSYNINIDDTSLEQIKTSISQINESQILKFIKDKSSKLKNKYDNNNTKKKPVNELFKKIQDITPDEKIQYNKLNKYFNQTGRGQKGGFPKGAILFPENQYESINTIKHFI
jgi:hypothetical protein